MLKRGDSCFTVPGQESGVKTYYREADEDYAGLQASACLCRGENRVLCVTLQTWEKEGSGQKVLLKSL